jgi:hypothetical protein
MAQTSEIINLKIASTLSIAVVMNLLVLVSYGMEMDKAKTQEPAFYHLPIDIRDRVLKRHFTQKIKCHGGARLRCKSNEWGECVNKTGKCFFHDMNEDERYDDISGTLQLALQNIASMSAVNYVVWYEFGRIRKRPGRIEAMRTPDDWQCILFATQYPGHISIDSQDSYLKTMQSSLVTYKKPIHSHFCRFHFQSDSYFNKMPNTLFFDHNLLLQPTVSIPVIYKDSDMSWLTDTGKTLIHHAFDQGHSSGYSLETKEKTWEISYPPDNFNTATYGNSSFPLAIGGKNGIFFIENALNKTMKKVYSEPVNGLILSIDNSIIWAYKELDRSTIIAINRNEDVAKTFHFHHLLPDEAGAFYCRLYSHPDEANQLVVSYKMQDPITKKERKEWRAFALSLSGSTLELQQVEYDNAKVVIKPQERSINDWREYGTEQAFTREQVFWRDQKPRDHGMYNTIHTDNHPANVFYYIDGIISTYNEQYSAVCGTRGDCACVWYTLPQDMTVPERMILEAACTYATASDYDITIPGARRNFARNRAQQLCDVLKRISNNKNNVERISKIIHDNVRTPSILGVIKQIFQSHVHYLGVSLPACAALNCYTPLTPLSGTTGVLGKSALVAGAGILGIFVGYGLYTLCNNTLQKRRYLSNANTAKILYVPAQ